MDKLTQEIRKTLQSIALHGYDLIPAESDILKAIQVYHEAKLKEELIKFAQQFYADEETCIHNINEYLKPGEKQYEIIDLKCDVCGFHPSVIITTSFGRFCQQHAKYI